MPKTKKKHNPRSEAAQRDAFNARHNLHWSLLLKHETVEVHAYLGSETYGIYDLRDCYRKKETTKKDKK